MRYKLFALVVASAGLMVTTPLETASAQDQQGQNQQGVSAALSQLSAQWWQWAISIPPGNNPVLDPTGDQCMVGQRDPVWFLTGAGFGGATPFTRSCSMPEGDLLFFPVINAFFVNTPNCFQGPQNLTVAFELTQIEPFIQSVHNMSVTLDGNPIKPIRLQASPFALAIPADNIFGPDACGSGVALPAGIYSPTVADGYYVALNLSARAKPYQIHFHAEAQSDVLGAATQDVTYHLTVVPVLRQ